MTMDKHNVHRGKDFLKGFCESLGEYTMNIINFKKKKNEVVNKRAVGMI